MTGQNPWDLLRHGRVEQGLVPLRRAYERKQSPSHIMELGIAYLFAGDYQAGWEHFQSAIKRFPYSMSSFYGMAGAAKWCVDDPDAAVKYWHMGLDAKFADGAGGIQLPLLLWSASVVRLGAFPRDEAETILRKRIETVRAANWPGPLARFALGLLDEKTLGQLATAGSMRDAPPHRKWLARFYGRVFELGRLNLSLAEFRESMRPLADTSRPEWHNERDFLGLMWTEEFFVARHEAFPVSQDPAV